MTHKPSEKTRRLDQWLWYARFYKSRSLAAKICRARKVRINGVAQSKASATVTEGDVLTFAKGERIFVVKVHGLGHRRGPAAEARALYEDLSPPRPLQPTPTPMSEDRPRGAGRPTKADRRAIERLKRLFRSSSLGNF